MQDWVSFQFPPKIFLEADSTHKFGSFVETLGTRPFLVTIEDELTNSDQLAVILTSIERHINPALLYDELPTQFGFEDINSAVFSAKQAYANVIIAYGSRQTINAAKAISLLIQNELFAEELPDAKLPLKRDPIPLIIVPTVPSMGEECTPYFSIFDKDNQTLYLGDDSRLFPSIIFIDPMISENVLAVDLIRGGIAILAVCIESILTKKSNDITNAQALKAIELVMKNLPVLAKDPKNKAARMGLAISSIMAGMAHSSTKLGLCYSLAFAAQNLTGIDIAMAMAILLPNYMEYNLTTSAGTYVQIARSLNEDIANITVIEAAIKAVEGVRKLYLELKLPQRLSEFEIRKDELSSIANMAFNFPLSKNTPREMSKGEIEQIIIAAY